MLSLDKTVSIDHLEQEVVACERLIGRLRARQLAALRQLDEAQVIQLDGSRTMTDWVAARLDVSHETARSLTTGMKLLAECPAEAEVLASGECSLDRAMATAKLRMVGADAQTIHDAVRFDIAGVCRMVSRRRRMTRTDERSTYLERYFLTQMSLDGGEGRGWFRLPGFDFTIVEKAIAARADQFRDLPGPSSRASARRADALVSLAQDSLELVGFHEGPASGSRDPLVTVLVDAQVATEAHGEAGAEIEFGPRVGPAALERILCGGRVQLVGVTSGRPVATTHATRSIPPSVRRLVAWRDGGCVIAGCRSRYRLEPHHMRHWADGGTHDPSNLATVCWYHHHVKIHGEGFSIDPESPPGRRRLRPPARGPDPPEC